jgi:hypothetical protein
MGMSFTSARGDKYRHAEIRIGVLSVDQGRVTIFRIYE